MLDGAAPELTAHEYAQRLLSGLNARPLRPVQAPSDHPAVSWAQSGLMWLTGAPDGALLMCPVPLAACADGALAALASLAPEGALAGLSGARLLAERAAITGARRQGAVSAGGSCRLLQAADGWLALNLARDDDWALLPAWLESGEVRDWDALSALLHEQSGAVLEQRARLLGLAVACSRAPQRGGAWCSVSHETPGQPTSRAPVVIDLSSLWAGPLCGALLQACGARVIKVESLRRPDGARSGPRALFDLLNCGKESVALDFSRPEGRESLRHLLERADIVIEASRPRALRQLGIDAAEVLGRNPGLTWVSVTAYGRDAANENAIGYGDDVAVAAGLSHLMQRATGRPLFVGDAIADPLTGLHAALAAWTSFQSGGGRLIAIAMHDVMRSCIGFDLPTDEALHARQAQWTRIAGAAAAPAGRAAHGVARPLGADTIAIVQQLGA